MLCPTLCNPMNCSIPDFPVLHYLPEFAQTHVHWVSDAIQPFYPWSPPSLALNLSQHQGLFWWVNSLHQYWSFSISPSNEYLGLISFRIDWQSKGILRVFSSTTIWKHQFFSAQPSLWSNSHICTWLLEKPCVCLVAYLCPTLCNPMDYSPPGSSVLGISQAKILEWVAISSSRGYSRPRDQPRSPTLQADSLLPEPTGCSISFFNLVSFDQ